MTANSVLTIILNYRTPELTIKSATAAVREMQGIPGEIVIVDNGSSDDSVAMIEAAIAGHGWNREGRVRLLQSGRNGGFGAGNNVGIRAGFAAGGRPDFVYILNSDAWPEPGAIARLRTYMITNTKVGVAGSYVRGPDGTPHQTAFRFPTIGGEFEIGAHTGLISRMLANYIVPLPMPQTDTRVDWVAGASAMMRREMLDEVGLFDETFFLYFEETDLCLRAARAGWQTHYVPASEVIHVGSASTGLKTWRRTPVYWFDSRLHYFTKNHGIAYAAAATLARVSGCTIWRIRRLFSGSKKGDPVGFLRDLVSHSIRAPFRRPAKQRGPAGPESSLTPSVVEDRK